MMMRFFGLKLVIGLIGSRFREAARGGIDPEGDSVFEYVLRRVIGEEMERV